MRIGDYQVVNGDNETVIGDYNTIKGSGCKVTGDNNKIYGNNNEIKGDYNEVRGSYNTVSGENNHCIGCNNTTTGTGNQLSGDGPVRTFGKTKPTNSQFVNNAVFMNVNQVAKPGNSQFVNNAVIFNQGQASRGKGKYSFQGPVNVGVIGDNVVMNNNVFVDDEQDDLGSNVNVIQHQQFIGSLNGSAISQTGNVVQTNVIGSIDSVKGPLIMGGSASVKPVSFIPLPNEEEKQKDKPTTEEDKQCCICLQNTANCIMQPCMHKKLCVECSFVLAKDKVKEQVECPICKKGIKKISYVYE